ncbi:hypothetical protein DENIT_70036 [Pseudomonas veronii]|uniref:hypothetical protein n=1 Tax=Pseudomonas veronii TaxID=76761 RepID=UPI001755E25C|nr:hypothetical protein [Pseudomonas veronii]CAD0266059.1 hypothetical protein DENIT_70036 [Pseudomonas veronii]
MKQAEIGPEKGHNPQGLSSQEEFLQWSTNGFFHLFQKDCEAALKEAEQKAHRLQPYDRTVIAATLAITAGRVREMGGLLGGGKLKVWLLVAILSVGSFLLIGGQWPAVPIGLMLLLARYDRRICMVRATAYSELASVLKSHGQ